MSKKKTLRVEDIDSTDSNVRNEGAKALIKEIETIALTCKDTTQEQTTATNVINAKRIFGDLTAEGVAVEHQNYFVALLKIELQRAQDAEKELL